MSIEYNPVGVACNLSCTYCYEDPMRDAGNVKKPLDVDKVKQALLEENSRFTIFGGEPLLAPIDHLEEMWKFGLERFGSNGIQSNGELITDQHIELFKKYKVHCGLSLDGPGDLNDSRWKGTVKATREATRKTHENIQKLIDNDLMPSLIITLQKGNVLHGRIEKLKAWLKSLDEQGLYSVRLHVLEVDNKDVAESMAMTPDENYQAFIEMHEFEKTLTNMKFDIFEDIRKLLRGDDNSVTCIWNACDPYTTSAVRGVDANGDQHNCGRTNKEGVNWHKAEQHGYERQLSLYHTPWEYNGCKGCRFFVVCKGQCPGTGDGFDWRNKTDNCWFWYKLIEYMETEMVANGEKPVSLHPQLREIEKIMLGEWAAGNRTNINRAIRRLYDHKQRNMGVTINKENHSDTHGDGAFTSHSYPDHGDEHGDSAHNDNSGHGDSYQ